MMGLIFMDEDGVLAFLGLVLSFLFVLDVVLV